MSKLLAIIFVFTLFSCEETIDVEITDLKGTWTQEWKQCDVYYNQNESSIAFTFNDTADNVMTVKELNADTILTTTLRFEFTDINTLVVDSVYTVNGSSDWIGTHQLTEVSKLNFLLKRQNTLCKNELFKFKK